MPGFLTPDARLRVFSDLSVVLPGAKLHTRVAGTPATPLATYSDSALTVPNTNPVVASAGGLFGPIYLTPGVMYDLELTDASDVTVWTQPNVSVPLSNALAAGAGISIVTGGGTSTISATGGGSNGINDFRLTLESGVPVSTTDQLAKTILYATPSGSGNRMALYDAAGAATVRTSAQFQIALPATTATQYDVFCYDNAGVPTLELLAWTNDTTRATAITLAITGTWTKAGDLTRRLLGTIYLGAVAGQTEDSAAKRYLGRVDGPAQILRAIDATDSWSYTPATYRQANANAANQVEVVVCVPGPIVDLTLLHLSTGAAGNVYAAIGEDSVTVPVAGQLLTTRQGDGNFLQLQASLTKRPAVGRHTYVWLEKGNTTATFLGDSGATMQSGLMGTLSGG